MATDWRHQGECRNHDPELFFPVGTSGPALLQIQEAKAVCRGCPVTAECLSWALASGQDCGVWGGLSEDERRALKRRNAGQRPAAAAETCGGRSRHPRTDANTHLDPDGRKRCRDCEKEKPRPSRARRSNSRLAQRRTA